ncbi:MAG: sugar phosphate isomerase/epimerase family protein [Bryobacteraceae bacterium]
MTRRQLLAAAGLAPAILSGGAAFAQSRILRNMGGTPTAFSIRTRAARDGGAPFDIVDHCHRLGLGAVQARLASFEANEIRKFRQRVEGYGMRAILSAPMPRDESDVARFDANVKSCKEAGAIALHTPMTGRRYEDFQTFEAFKENFERCKKIISLAEPVLRKHRLRLAIENHKGWRAGEHAEWIRRVDSEWIGVCFDSGNNLSLCEDPMETLRLLAPYTVFCHIKDMGVEDYPDGFLLSEVVFGDGVVDLHAVVRTLQKVDRNMVFALEMITRDPLKIPVFTEGYWATFDDSYSPLPGRDLARVLDIVRKNPPKKPLPKTSGLSREAQINLEDDLNRQCIDWARQHLNLA